MTRLLCTRNPLVCPRKPIISGIHARALPTATVNVRLDTLLVLLVTPSTAFYSREAHPMDTLRRRIPFKLADENDDNHDGLILDEERTESLDILSLSCRLILPPEQDALIESLRKENEIVNRWYSSALILVVALSCAL